MGEFYKGLAEIFEVDVAAIGPGFSLVEHGWDSLAMISCVVLIDDCYGNLVSGTELARCTTVADLETLAARAVAA